MLTSLLIMVREGFEGALVVALVFAYLRRMGRLDVARHTWIGVALALAVSIGVGVVVHLTTGQLEGAARLRVFAGISIAAVIVLTWMIFWMRRQSRAIKGELERAVDRALGSDNVGRAMAMVAFVGVLREGIEAALFLIAAATESSGRQVLIGGFGGLAIAVVLAYLVYAGGRRLPLKTFFTVTGVILIVFAAGLLARTVLYLQSSGDLQTVWDNVYDLTGVSWLTQQTEVGKFLAAMLGWDPRPSIEQIVAWVAYAGIVSVLFLRPSRPAPEPAAPEPARVPVAR
jgi:high-affinity iron transporter